MLFFLNPPLSGTNSISIIRGVATLPQLSIHYNVKHLILWLSKRFILLSCFPYNISIMQSVPLFSPKPEDEHWICVEIFFFLYEKGQVQWWATSSGHKWLSLRQLRVQKPLGFFVMIWFFVFVCVCFVWGFFVHGKTDFLPAWDTKETVWPWLWSLKLICDFNYFLSWSARTFRLELSSTVYISISSYSYVFKSRALSSFGLSHPPPFLPKNRRYLKTFNILKKS